MEPLGERFWSKVEILGPDDCWEWLGEFTRDGLPRNGGPSSRKNLATDYALSTKVPRPAGHHAVSACGILECVNPTHLKWVEGERLASKPTGLGGVSRMSDGTYRASFRHRRTRRFIGYFPTFDAAAEALATERRKVAFETQMADVS